MTVYGYKGMPLSLGPVLASTSYLFVTWLSAIFFKERVTAKKAFALALIVAGTTVYAIGLPG